MPCESLGNDEHFSENQTITMNIRIKTIVLTLSILIITLLLNSILSLASFEKIYVKSLISIYEMAGKNLKKKIESSLRFGKPLDRFQGMDSLLEELLKKEPEISRVDIVTATGKILYHAAGDKYMNREIQYDISTFDKTKGGRASTRLMNGMYWICLPLYDGSNRIAALLRLSFSREVVYVKLKGMAIESLNVLWIIMLLTSMGLIFLLGILIIRPIKREIKVISDMLEWPENPGETNYQKMTGPGIKGRSFPQLSTAAAIGGTNFSFSREDNFKHYSDIKKINNEIDRLGWYVHTFVRNSTGTLQMIDASIPKQREIFELCENPKEFETLVRRILEKENFQFKGCEREILDRVIHKNRRLFERLLVLTDHLEIRKNMQSTHAAP